LKLGGGKSTKEGDAMPKPEIKKVEEPGGLLTECKGWGSGGKVGGRRGGNPKRKKIVWVDTKGGILPGACWQTYQ